MLATMMVMPGGLVLLVAVALAIVLLRTSRGQRLLLPLRRRIPPRLREHAKRVWAIATGEKLFLPEATQVRSV
jgi:hypothetical protein